MIRSLLSDVILQNTLEEDFFIGVSQLIGRLHSPGVEPVEGPATHADQCKSSKGLINCFALSQSFQLGEAVSPALQFVGSVLGVDKILFAADYPFESMKESVQFMDNAQISDIEREKIYHLNKEKLLGLLH